MKGVRRWLANTFGIVEIGTDNRFEKVSPEMAQLYVIGGIRVPSVGVVLSGRYRIDQLIGHGGIAVVYRGFDLEVHHTIAVKVLMLDSLFNKKRDRDPELERCLRNEARAVMSLSHPSITRVYNYERHKPWEYLIMEFVSGQNLHVLSRARPNGRFELKETIHIGLDVLDALSHAHKQGVIHNDITPRNILVDQHNEIKLCDFGLSILTDLQIKRPATNPQQRDNKGSRSIHSTMGTVAYMSPERIQGKPVDTRSDLYSLGATLYTLATGHAPFGTRLKDVAKGQASGKTASAFKLPRSLEAILLKAMKNDPNGRFNNAQEMADALLEVLHNLPSPYIANQDTVTRPLVHKRNVIVPPTSSIDPPQGNHKSEYSQLQLVQKQAPVTAATLDKSVSKISPLKETFAPPPPSIKDKPISSVNNKEVSPLDMVWISSRNIEYENRHYDIGGFYMDRTPVTNTQYAKFVDAQHELPPSWWSGSLPPADKRDHPVVGITIAQARRYAQWCGKRLPTTLEWIAVVRGIYGQQFTPGNIPKNGNGASGTAPVAEHLLGASNEGCMDMLGNVWEWTEQDPRFTPPDAESYFVMGGSYRHPCGADEEVIPRSTVGKFGEYLYLGFRCARDKD
jgi:serine/threonine protein kinase